MFPTNGRKAKAITKCLEFLGDAVLDLAVSDLLMRRNPEKSEGDLSRMRAALVNSTVLAEKAALLNLGALLRIGKGEERSDGRNKPSILAGAFEAVLGGMYQDGGYEAARAVVERYLRRRCDREKARPAGLQDAASGNQPDAVSRAAGLSPGHRETGPDHDKRFRYRDRRRR